ncbi:radical SAM protein [Streptomyces sioyaensis]|uniref:radical SAM protein n=1 Tax=Streptomyces sioyaensis TaxID=67364 RepID=UPI001F16A24C|nr:radical SAM protein [Streptomyces sioyaensis]MCF3172863.1 radical SAM protein [Streptomyces sioyaensis]
MGNLNLSGTPVRQTLETTPIERVVWDLTYACPLRCVHCLSESGRRPASMLRREDALKVAHVIINAGPKRVSIGGGEPLLAPWWEEATRLLTAAGIPTTIFTSGWLMSEAIAHRLSDSVTGVAVSVDGASDEVHDLIRGRPGSFQKSMTSLDRLNHIKRERRNRGESHYRLGVEYTVTRSGWEGKGRFVEEITSRFQDVDYITFGAVIPEGLAQEEEFASRELLSDEQLVALSTSETMLASYAKSGADISVTDARLFLPTSPQSVEGETIAHIEANGQLRAVTNYEAKVGSVLEEPLEVLWSRALDWRNDPFVAQQRNSIRNLNDWARVTRLLDRRYGSAVDKLRIARRSEVT